jgi:hypothetical protein
MACSRADTAEVLLRPRRCSRCQAIFYICCHCDRGQRYCSPFCRTAALREQRRQANRRHQQSPAGREDHRDRQRAYRKRCAQRRWVSAKNVTDTSSPALTSSRMIAAWNTGSTLSAVPVRCLAPAVGLQAWPPWRQHARNVLEYPPRLPHCVICGRHGRFVNPFSPIPR